MDYVFPFDKVEKNSRVVVWGIGNMGNQFLSQIAVTGYCNIVAVVDKEYIKYSGYTINGFVVSSPCIIKELEYDYIVIAIDSNQAVEMVVSQLTEYNVKTEKIVNNLCRSLSKPVTEIRDSIAEYPICRIKIINKEGIGDVLFDLYFINSIKSLLKSKVSIDLVCKYKNLFLSCEGINIFLPDEEEPDIFYDLVCEDKRLFEIRYWKEKRIISFSEQLWKFCLSNKRIREEIFCSGNTKGQINIYSKLLGIKRYEQSNMESILDYKKPSIKVDKEMFKSILNKYHLPLGEYITINRGEGHKLDRSPKLWSIDRYNELIRQIKERYPNILVVQVGADDEFGVFDRCDVNLCGKTNLTEVIAILWGALLHIDNEGGLVHLRYMLGGKSVVLFGPTEIELFGYDCNYNIRCCECVEACCNYVHNWYCGCILTKGESVCMNNISVDMVINEVIKGINEAREETDD